MPQDPDALAARLNRDLPAGRGWTPEAAQPFGPALAVYPFRLGNGLRVLLLPDPSAPVISYQTWFGVGSGSEDPEKTGLAHFFEHMMFNATERHPQGEFDRLLEAAGGETNAATWIDWTYYYENLPADALPLAVELEADRMRHLVVREPQVESEREVVANERRMAVEDDVQGAAAEKLYELAFGRHHPHGWPTIGWMDHIEGYRVEDCQRFYARWYAPNNATVVLTGAFEPEDALRQIASGYGGFDPSSRPPGRPRPAAARGGDAEIRWPTPTAKALFGWPAPAYGDRAHATATMVDELLTGGRSGRLRHRLVEELELVSEVSTSVTPLRHEGLFELWVSVRDGVALADVERVVDEELDRLRTTPVGADELQKVLNRSELLFLSEIESVGGKAQQVGFSDRVTGDPCHAWVRLDELRGVDAASVQALAQHLFDPARRVAVRVVPDGGGA